MKRRGFFGALFGAAALPLVKPASASKTVRWDFSCWQCKKALHVELELADTPIGTHLQCPDCLAIQDLTGLSEKIFAAQGKDKHGRPA